MQMNSDPAATEYNNSIVKKRFIVFVGIISVAMGAYSFVVLQDVPLQYLSNFMEHGPVVLAFCIFCSYIVLKRRELSLDESIVISFIATTVALLIVAYLEPWEIAQALRESAINIIGAIIAIWLRQFIILLVWAGGLSVVLSVTFKVRPANLRLFIVRLLLIIAAVSSAIVAAETSLSFLATDLTDYVVSYLLYSFEVFFRVLVSGFAFYFVTTSFLNDVKPFGIIPEQGVNNPAKNGELAVDQDRHRRSRVPHLVWMLLLLFTLFILRYLSNVVGEISFDLVLFLLYLLTAVLLFGSLIVWSRNHVLKRYGIKQTLTTIAVSAAIYFLVNALIVMHLLGSLLRDYTDEPYATILLNTCSALLWFICFIISTRVLMKKAKIGLGKNDGLKKTSTFILAIVLFLFLSTIQGVYSLYSDSLVEKYGFAIGLVMSNDWLGIFMRDIEILAMWLFAVACIWKFETSADDD